MTHDACADVHSEKNSPVARGPAGRAGAGLCQPSTLSRCMREVYSQNPHPSHERQQGGQVRVEHGAPPAPLDQAQPGQQADELQRVFFGWVACVRGDG